jgi:hypothetical protein
MTQWGLDALFNPAKRHMDEEKRRLATTREQIGDSSGGRRVDLEGGKVVIQRHKDDPADESSEPESGTAPSAASAHRSEADPDTPAGRARARRQARRSPAKH